MNLLKRIYQTIKHGDECDKDYHTQCPSGYFCHQHTNPIRQAIHYVHCRVTRCPYVSLAEEYKHL